MTCKESIPATKTSDSGCVVLTARDCQHDSLKPYCGSGALEVSTSSPFARLLADFTDWYGLLVWVP